MELQEALKRLRDELSLTQTQLAEQLGVSFATISRWENGKVVPNMRVAAEVMEKVEAMPVSPSCTVYLRKALFPEETDPKLTSIRRLDMNMAGQLIDDSSVGVFVCDANTYELLYLNKTMEQWGGKIDGASIPTCYAYLAKRNSPCPWCAKKAMAKDRYIEREDHLSNGHHYLAKGKLIDWEGKTAIVEYISNESETLSKQKVISQMVDQLPCGIGTYHFSLDGRLECAYPNNRLLEMLHITRETWEENKQTSAMRWVFPADRDVLLTEVQTAVWEHRNISVDIRLCQESQSAKWFHITGSVSQASGDKAVLYLLFADIDESKRLFLHLQNSHQVIDTCAKIAKTAFFRYDLQHKQLSFYGQFEAEAGKPQKVKDITKTIVEKALIHPDDMKLFGRILKEIETGHWEQEWLMRIKRRNAGTFQWARCVISIRKIVMTSLAPVPICPDRK